MTISDTSLVDPPTGAGPAGAMAGLCRLTVHGPGRRFDLAVPTDIQLADLMPTIVGHAGEGLDEQGMTQGGWVLQRLGAEPLPPARTAAELELRDGEVLYLRPQQASLPPVHFDDLVDGVMSTLSTRSDTWQPELTQRLLLGVMLAVLLLAAACLPLVMPPIAAAANGYVVAAVLFGASASAVHSFDQTRLGHVLALAAVVHVVVAGAMIPFGDDLAGQHLRLLVVGMLAAAAAAVAFAVTGAAASTYLGIGTLGLLTWLAGALVSSSFQHTAAVVGAVVVLLLAFVPGWAFWLSGLRLPPLPANADQLQDGIEPHPSQNVIERSAVADAFLTGLLLALGTAMTVAVLTLVVTADGISARLMAGALSGLILLHGRSLGGTGQRLAVIGPGLAGLAALAVSYLVLTEGLGPMFMANLLWILALGLAVASGTIPGRRMVPHWARAGEILHTMLAISLLPLLLLCLGVFTRLRGLGG
ncbi:type VII secretion integral membrane protein EccD [Kineosporia sp. NBRC 101677]|uniref:type VII secretion integral membrane protein EccD n=1 Tax=Kineosporia sp. NBRC 101677 TaxID=3032197 RepID=UPI0024A0FA09|nr:type VII secretion integral membrane protein EccD [Kineosporia sp. NBRC 101677]GLY20165.1 type VII secretion integral membrane protein EccD [Kineosporia sp. NBRC 101677]